MKYGISHFTIVLILVFFTLISCQKEDEWISIAAVKTDNQLTEQLDSIFSADNNCLKMVESKSQLYALFSSNNFKELDDCHQTPEINFNDYTLIAGKVQVSSISDKIASIELTSKNSTYKVEVIIDNCAECYGGFGYLYFWKSCVEVS